MKIFLRKATILDSDVIWKILQKAIAKRKEEGSSQWQDGYPNPEVIRKDIEKEVAFVLIQDNVIVGYVAILINGEPEYNNLEGNWITNSDYVVFHRFAIAREYIGKGLAKKMLLLVEEYALQNNIYSIKADTNFDNTAMLAIFEQFDFTYCGVVCFRNTPRNAYEKVLK